MMIRRAWVGSGVVVGLIAGIVIWGQGGVEEHPVTMRTQKQQRMASYGYPDEFLRYHAEIRSSEDGSSYPPNYHMVEYNKAVSRRKTPGVPIGWVERGPANVPGRTRALVVDPEDPSGNTWFSGSVSGGLWKTTDSGNTWEALTDHLPNISVSALAITETNPVVIYMGTGEGFGNFDASVGAGIFKSEDRGTTWVQLPATATNYDFRWVNRLVVDPSDGNALVAATNAGVYRTSDGGRTWVASYVDSERRRVQDLRANPEDFQVQYATVTGAAVIKSDDGGQSWRVVLDNFIAKADRMELAIAPSNTDVVYIVADGRSTAILYQSRDAGQTWTAVLESENRNWLGNQGWYDIAAAVHPYDDSRLFLGGIFLWTTKVGSTLSSRRTLTDFQRDGTNEFMSFINVDGNFFGGTLFTGDVLAFSQISPEDYRSIEIRFGRGLTQKAHRFTVSPTDGTNEDGGAGVQLGAYRYKDYVDVPFEVWDIDTNSQLMVSFRDQSDNGVFNLIHENNSGQRDTQSREYVIVHDLSYDANAPHPILSSNGGLRWRLMYFLGPVLADGAEWDEAALPVSTLRLVASTVTVASHTAQIHPQNHVVHVDHHSLQLMPLDRTAGTFTVIGTNDGGVALSTNGGQSMRHVGNGYNTTQFYGVAKRPGTEVYMGGSQDNGTWLSGNDPGANSGWHHRIGGDGFDAIWHASDNGYMLGSSQFNGIWRSVDGGETFKASWNGLHDTGDNGHGQFITVFGYSPERPDRVFAVGRSGVWVSQDFGGNWKGVYLHRDEWTSHLGAGGKVEVSLADPDVVWAGYRMDEIRPVTGLLHVSNDGGRSFRPTNVPDFAPQSFLSGIATHPTVPGAAYVLFSVSASPKILSTSDYGETWKDLSGFVGEGESTNGFPDVAVHDLLVMPDSPSHYWAATEIGLFESKDAGSSWHYADNGLPAVSIWQMKVQDDEIILATHGRGIWTVDLPEVVAAVDAPELPEVVLLEQNYPNPFAAKTTIDFNIPTSSQVRVRVFDVAGREVATLADAHFIAGSHRLSWEAAGVASGLYHYRLETEAVVRTRTMMLIK